MVEAKTKKKISFAGLRVRRELYAKLALTAVLLFFFSQPASAQAPMRSCESFFSQDITARETPTLHESVGANENASWNSKNPIVIQRNLLASIWNQVVSKKFSAEEFDRAKAKYHQNRDEALQVRPRSSEERLALFEVLSEQNSLGLESLSSQIKRLAPNEQKKFVNQFSARRFDKGLHTEEANRLFTQMYLLTHVEPRTWRQVLSQPLSKSLEAIIRQRAELELGRVDFVTALERLGMIREPDMRGKLQAWTARNAAAIELSRAVGLNAASFALTGLLSRPPSVLELFAKPRFAESDLQLLRDQQWVGARTKLLLEAKSYARADLALTIGMKITSGILMGVAIGYFAPIMIQATLPPGYSDKDEGLLALANDSVRYWFGVAHSYITGDTANPFTSEQQQRREQDIDHTLEELNAS